MLGVETSVMTCSTNESGGRLTRCTVQRVTTTAERRPVRVSTVAWWLATVLTLVVLDDLTFGPAFWALSRLADPAVAVIAIFAIYVPAQVLIVVQATGDAPSRPARFFLRRMDLERRNEQIAHHEESLRSHVVGAGSAVAVTLLIAGVLPPLLLWRHGWARRRVLALAVVTAVVYAAEFALLHGFLPSLI